MTLTQAEREAVETVKRRAAQIKSEASGSLPTPLEIVAGVIDRLLSSRAVPMETVAWWDGDTGDFTTAFEHGKVLPYHTQEVVLRSAAEAYTEGLRAMVEKLEAALTPSAETKAAYMGEFRFWIDEHDEEGQRIGQRIIAVPWTTIKEVMAAISARALTSTETPKDGL